MAEVPHELIQVGDWGSDPGHGYQDGVNLYQYCMPRPVTVTDPTGMAVFQRIGPRRNNACDCTDDCDVFYKEHRRTVNGFWSTLKWLFSHKKALETCYINCFNAAHRAIYIGAI